MLKHYRLHLISTIVVTGKFRIADLHWKVLTQWAIYLNDSMIKESVSSDELLNGNDEYVKRVIG